jgi:hypothetical protein
VFLSCPVPFLAGQRPQASSRCGQTSLTLGKDGTAACRVRDLASPGTVTSWAAPATWLGQSAPFITGEILHIDGGQIAGH